MIQPVFVLIHGTNAKGAGWIRENSRLSTALRDRFFGGEIVPFTWSGANSHQDRLSAGMELSHTVNSLIEQQPERPIYLIAHSHGGNVALYALRDENVEWHVKGIVCMATPFLECNPREPDTAIAAFAYATLGILCSLMALAAFAAVMTAIEGNKNLGIVFGLVAVGFFGLFGFLNPEYKTGRLQTWLRDKAEEKQRTTMKRLSHRLVRTPMLCVAPVRDEARLLLSSLERTAEIPFILWKVAVFITLLNTMALMFALRGSSERALVWLETSFGGCVLALVVLQLLMWLIPAVVRSHPLGFGRERGMDNWLVRVYCMPDFQGVATSHVKIGGETIIDVEKAVEANRLKRFLRKRRHSLIYSDKDTIEMIVEWIAGVETSRQEYSSI